MAYIHGNNAQDQLVPGLYEQLVTDDVAQLLHDSDLQPIIHPVEHGEEPYQVSTLVKHRLEAVLEDLPADDALQLSNHILQLIDTARLRSSHNRLQRLDELVPSSIVVDNLVPTKRPSTPLGEAALLTNSGNEPNLGAELKAELVSADRVDLLCAFIKWHGIRVIADELKALHDRGVPFRVLTTTYIGATEKEALDRLVNEFGAKVKVNYELQATRLHAKAWMFYRNSGFHSSYVGSSNLSKQALIEGKEWNVRLGMNNTPSLIRKFNTTFETYWNDEAFEPYDPQRDGPRLKDSLHRSSNFQEGIPLELSGLDVRPYPFQEGILEQLQAERDVHGYHRNLIVAATGTGKTLMAAFDYQRLTQANNGRRPRLLFIAHRKEILRQSVRAFREVLKDANFGQLWDGTNKPSDDTHLFASIQTIGRADLSAIKPDSYDVIIIDEFHHGAAASYQKVLDYFKPQELLGLTATPERGDGINVKELFNGRYAAEMRLWDALEEDLLVPFQYFGINDETDLSTIEWKAGQYVNHQLSNVYDGNEARVRLIINAVTSKVTNLSSMKALGFCVDVDHAEYMTRMFNHYGIPSATVTGKTGHEERKNAVTRLQEGTINCIFSVDVFNEGLDIPAVNTLLMLRPTQSSTIFLQQLGRGLRHYVNKDVLTVLDFVGNQNENFSFEHKFRALTGFGRKRLVKNIEHDFPYLPSGCTIVLDKVTQERVLTNVKSHIKHGSRWLLRDLVSHIGNRDPRHYRLGDFLDETGRKFSDIYRYTTWTQMLRTEYASKFPIPAHVTAEEDKHILNRLKKLIHVDDPERGAAYQYLLQPDAPHYDDLDHRQQLYARMLFFLFFQNKGNNSSFQDGLEKIRQHTDACAEACGIIDISVGATRHAPRRLGDTVLFSHATYDRQEVFAALEYATWEKPMSGLIGGVAWMPESKTDAFFVQLNKSERDFSPQTMYRDYAVSPHKFHWESQNRTAADSPSGQRYIHHQDMGSNVLLFVREHGSTDYNTAEPYFCLGYMNYLEHHGEKPMEIIWQLERPMPHDVFRVASAVARPAPDK